jgi:two-component system, NarL family, nitrate/nitrite response regulator NarL
MPPSVAEPIRVCAVSDSALYREGLDWVLRAHDEVEVVGAFSYGWGDLEAAAGLEPDVAVADAGRVEVERSLDRLVARLEGVPVVAVAVPASEAAILACAQAGASALLTPAASSNELVNAIESVARGEPLCSPAIGAVLLRCVQTLARGRGGLLAERLTPREREIVGLIRSGSSNREIASRLSIELSTVKNHVHNILEKLGVHERAAAAAALGPASPVRPAAVDHDGNRSSSRSGPN